MFNPAPYQGYQPAPPPPSYEPPQFARFDVSKNGRVNGDALPAMPSWDAANKRKILDEEQNRDEDMEMGRLDPVHAQQAPMLGAQNEAPPPRAGYAEVDSTPYQQYGAYNGGDLGNPYGQQESGIAYGGTYAQRNGGQQQQQASELYGGPYSGRGGFSAFTPSGSTRYEPSSVGLRSGGGSYSPMSPAAERQYARGRPPGGLQVGRKAVSNSWRDV
ncbi:hypothetical protein MMC08_000779 [Hypocenomyce scalaris]|nr:hypothetical protein [Hypocenomyce scalaris]